MAVWNSSITNIIFKRKCESKKGTKSQPVRYMCHAEIRHCTIQQMNRYYSSLSNYWTPLVQKKCPLIRGVSFFESWATLVLFSKNYYFCTYIWCSQGKWKTSGSLWTKKKKEEMMLSCCNLNCFKMKYQLVKSIIQTLF